MCDPETGSVEPVCVTDCLDAYVNCGNEEGSAACADPGVYRNISEDETAASCGDRE